MIEEFAAKRVKFVEKANKLEQIREEKIAMIARNGNINSLGNTEQGTNSIEMFDDTASMATTSSLISTARSKYSSISSKSHRTSRSRRKMAKKRETGKDSFYLDEYLMKSLQEIIQKMNTYLKGEEIQEILQILMVCHEYDLARAVQKELLQYCGCIKVHQQTIFRIQVIEKPVIEELDEKPALTIIEPISLTEYKWSLQILQ